MVGILVSFWDGLFSGAMLVSGSVIITSQLLQSDLLIPQMEVTFSARSKGHLWVLSRGHFEEPGGIKLSGIIDYI